MAIAYNPFKPLASQPLAELLNDPRPLAEIQAEQGGSAPAEVSYKTTSTNPAVLDNAERYADYRAKQAAIHDAPMQRVRDAYPEYFNSDGSMKVPGVETVSGGGAGQPVLRSVTPTPTTHPWLFLSHGLTNGVSRPGVIEIDPYSGKVYDERLQAEYASMIGRDRTYAGGIPWQIAVEIADRMGLEISRSPQETADATNFFRGGADRLLDPRKLEGARQIMDPRGRGTGAYRTNHGIYYERYGGHSLKASDSAADRLGVGERFVGDDGYVYQGPALLTESEWQAKVRMVAERDSAERDRLRRIRERAGPSTPGVGPFPPGGGGSPPPPPPGSGPLPPGYPPPPHGGPRPGPQPPTDPGTGPGTGPGGGTDYGPPPPRGGVTYPGTTYPDTTSGYQRPIYGPIPKNTFGNADIQGTGQMNTFGNVDISQLNSLASSPRTQLQQALANPITLRELQGGEPIPDFWLNFKNYMN